MYEITRLLRRAAMLCMLALLLICSHALADESMQVSIPVTAHGADCTVALYDAGGHRVQFLNLKAGQESAFVVNCVGLKRFTYTALVTNDDTENVSYDRRNYRITIDLIYDENDQLCANIFIENLTSSECKLQKLEFFNTIIPHAFTFTKQWSGDHEDSIKWVLYTPDGTETYKRFEREIITDYEWRYEAWFSEKVDDYYLIEVPPEGYLVHYENVGKYSDVIDRCHTGGTIINYKVPQTSDPSPIATYYLLAIASLLGLCLLGLKRRKPPSSSKT